MNGYLHRLVVRLQMPADRNPTVDVGQRAILGGIRRKLMEGKAHRHRLVGAEPDGRAFDRPTLNHTEPRVWFKSAPDHVGEPGTLPFRTGQQVMGGTKRGKPSGKRIIKPLRRCKWRVWPAMDC